MSAGPNFCSNCGEKLDIDEDIEVCPKCHTALHEHSKHIDSNDKNSKETPNDKQCSNPNCGHRNDEHYSPLHPKSSGDPLDTSCRLCNCEKFQ